MKEYLSITDMADIHQISRQTLIFYDKIGLFKPELIDQHGYRYYSPLQIPLLREICFLKSIGVKLEEIKEHFQHRDLNSAIAILDFHSEMIEQRISQLKQNQAAIEARLTKYRNAEISKRELNKPFFKEIAERRVVFTPFKNAVCKKEIHMTHMKSRKILVQHQIIPSKEFGTIIRQNSIGTDTIFRDAGVYVHSPEISNDFEQVMVLPGGLHVCMFKYGMPYDVEHLFSLLGWIRQQGYALAGDIVDMCLLDTTFHRDDTQVDFCELQIPVK